MALGVHSKPQILGAGLTPANEWWYRSMEYKWKLTPVLGDYTNNIQALWQACGESFGEGTDSSEL